MTETSSQYSHPDRLAVVLTELVTRLRLSFSPFPARLVVSLVPQRLATAGRLLVLAGSRQKNERFLPLSRALEEFHQWSAANPGRCPRSLDRPLESLAEFLESLLVEIDQGTAVGEVGADSRWLRLLAEFSPQHDSAGEIADPGGVLDRLFRRPVLPAAPPAVAELTIRGQRVEFGLLLDSHFQRDEVADRIQSAGSPARLLAEPSAAAEWIERKSGSAVLLGDNREPTRNLERVLTLLSSAPPRPRRACVLVCGSPVNGMDPGRRAEVLGAVGAWASPHRLEDLQNVLARVSA